MEAMYSEQGSQGWGATTFTRFVRARTEMALI